MKLPSPQYGKDTDETIRNLFGVILKFRRELEYLMYHLADDNIISLDASKIRNLEAFFIDAGTITTDVLYAGIAHILELTVDRLQTKDYINGESPLHFIRIQDQYIQFIEAEIIPELPKIQHTNRRGDLLYWIDETETHLTLEDTGLPVMVHQYDEDIKMQIAFLTDPESGYNIPIFQLGEGDGVLENSGKGFISKDIEGIKFIYYSNNLEKYRGVKILDKGPVAQMGPNDSPEYSDEFILRNFGVTNDYATNKGGESRVGDVLVELGEPIISDDLAQELIGGGVINLHKHTEAEIVDLNKYTKGEVDTLIDDTVDMMSSIISPYLQGYVHTQSTPSAEWIIVHSLNKYPQVTIVDSAGNEVETEIEYIDLDTIKSTSSGAFSGEAYVN